MIAKKGSNMILNALIIAVIIGCAYYFVGRKHFGPLINELLHGNTTALDSKSPFRSIKASVNTYNDKVAEEGKTRDEALDALSRK